MSRVVASSVTLLLHQQVNTIIRTLRQQRSDLRFEITQGYLVNKSFFLLVVTESSSKKKFCFCTKTGKVWLLVCPPGGSNLPQVVLRVQQCSQLF